MKFREAKKKLNPLDQVQIGEIKKPHGYKGHLKFNLYFDPTKLTEESVFAGIDGWLVPFFIDYEESNFTAIKPIIKFEEINSEQEAEQLSNRPIFLPRQIAKKYVNLDSLQYMIGYQIEDITSSNTGKIIDFIYNEKNPLVKVLFNGQDYLIPVRGTQIKKINHTKRHVIVELPHSMIN